MNFDLRYHITLDHTGQRSLTKEQIQSRRVVRYHIPLDHTGQRSVTKEQVQRTVVVRYQIILDHTGPRSVTNEQVQSRLTPQVVHDNARQLITNSKNSGQLVGKLTLLAGI